MKIPSQPLTQGVVASLCKPLPCHSPASVIDSSQCAFAEVLVHSGGSE